MKLYVANTKKQVHVFTYRLVERPQAFQRPIPPGGQVVIDNLTQEDVDWIIKQNEAYGMRRAAEVSRQKGFVGFCYSTSDPIKVDRMLETFTNNDKALTAEAQDRLEITASAISQNIGAEVAKAIRSDKPVVPQRLEIEVTEETSGDPAVARGVEVVDTSRTQPKHTLSRKKN